jgi:hypothetical protein
MFNKALATGRLSWRLWLPQMNDFCERHRNKNEANFSQDNGMCYKTIEIVVNTRVPTISMSNTLIPAAPSAMA